MPQLKKVALAMGNHLAYADTYEQALALLIAQTGGQPGPLQLPGQQQVTQQPGGYSGSGARPGNRGSSADGPAESGKAKAIARSLHRYRQLNSQGKFAEAGKELEAIQQLLKQ